MSKLKQTFSSDSDTLAALGKKQVLKRRFGFWSLFGCVTLKATAFAPSRPRPSDASILTRTTVSPSAS